MLVETIILQMSSYAMGAVSPPRTNWAGPSSTLQARGTHGSHYLKLLGEQRPSPYVQLAAAHTNRTPTEQKIAQVRGKIATMPRTHTRTQRRQAVA